VLKPVVAWLRNRWGGQAGDVHAAYRACFNSPTGRLVLADLAAMCGLSTTSFTPGDPGATAFAEGRRAVFLHIADTVGLTPGDLAEHLIKKEYDIV